MEGVREREKEKKRGGERMGRRVEGQKKRRTGEDAKEENLRG